MHHDDQPEMPGNDEDAAVAKRRQALRRLAVYGGLTSAFMVTSLTAAKATPASRSPSPMPTPVGATTFLGGS